MIVWLPKSWENNRIKKAFWLFRCGSLFEHPSSKMNLYSWYKALSGCILDHRKLLCVQRDRGVILHPVSHFHDRAFTTKENSRFHQLLKWWQNDFLLFMGSIGSTNIINLSFLFGGSKWWNTLSVLFPIRLMFAHSVNFKGH